MPTPARGGGSPAPAAGPPPPGAAGDLVDADVEPALLEGGARGGEDAVVVALGVAAQRGPGGGGHPASVVPIRTNRSVRSDLRYDAAETEPERLLRSSRTTPVTDAPERP